MCRDNESSKWFFVFLFVGVKIEGWWRNREAKTNIHPKTYLYPCGVNNAHQKKRCTKCPRGTLGLGLELPNEITKVHGICLILVSFHSTGSAQKQLAPMWSEADKLVPLGEYPFCKPCTFPTTWTATWVVPAWRYGPSDSITLLLHGKEQSLLLLPHRFPSR